MPQSLCVLVCVCKCMCMCVSVCVYECACNTFPLILSGVSVLELKPLSPNPLLAVTCIYSFAFVSLYLYLCFFVRIMLLLLLLTFARRSIIIIIKASPHLLKLLIRGNGSARHLHNASERCCPCCPCCLWHVAARYTYYREMRVLVIT